jgi:hypothetical protein
MQKSELATSANSRIKKNGKLKSGKNKILARQFARDPLNLLVAGSSISPREQLRQLLNTVKLVRRGDFSVRAPLTKEKES